MRPLIMLVVVGMLLNGCAPLLHSSTKMNSLTLGMSKQEVIALLGEPTSTGATGSTEYLTYMLHVSGHRHGEEYTPHFVRLINGKVEAYGRVGDFDSTKPNEINVNVNQK